MGRLRAAEFAEVNGLLASVVERGMDLGPAMDLLVAQAQGRSARAALEAVARRLREGIPLPEALAGSPDLFPEDYRVLVKAGLESGRLGEVLRLSQDYSLLRARILRNVARLVLYLSFGLVLCTAVLFALDLWAKQMDGIMKGINLVRSQLGEIVFRGMGCWWIFPLGVVALIGLGSLLLRLLGIWKPLRGLGYFVPVWGRLQRSRDLALFTTVLALRTRAGVPLVEGLGSAAAAVRNVRAREAAGRVQARVREGESLSTALFYERLFPRTLAWGISLGEARGDVPGMFQAFGRIYSADHERNCQILLQILTPLGILALGNLVLLTVMVLLAAVFDTARFFR